MKLCVETAARRLEAGEVVAYPTETVYGLGCDVKSESAIARLCTLKGRPAERGFSILLEGAAALEEQVAGLHASARRLARSFWPGPLTLVVEGASAAFPLVATDRGVAFRCSPHEQAAALVAACGVFIASTSANRTAEEPARSRAEVEAIFGEEFPVAGGAPAGGALPSTVVAIGVDGGIELLREGAIAFSELEQNLRPREGDSQ